LKREIFEETGILPEIAECICVRELQDLAGEHTIDYIFSLQNNQDFSSFRPEDTSHHHEYVAHGFFSQEEIRDPGIPTLPQDIFALESESIQKKVHLL